MIQQQVNDTMFDFKGVGMSNCCGAGTYGDYLICEECGEHCEDVRLECSKCGEPTKDVGQDASMCGRCAN